MPRASIDLWQDRALVLAHLGRVAVHAHVASALLVGIGLGYWAYWLDPLRQGASILIMPVIVVMLLACVTFFITGLISHKMNYG